MSKKLSFLLFLFTFLLSSCEKNDPTPAELAKGSNLDIERMEGEVVSVGTGYYVGDQEHTKDQAGKPYYWVRIRYFDQQNQVVNETFKGILPEVRDSLTIGMKLQGGGIFLTLSQLSRMDGSIVDLQANLKDNWFFITIESLERIPRVYEVDKITYYRIKELLSGDRALPLKLPLDILTNK
jgi:hypothetical protein